MLPEDFPRRPMRSLVAIKRNRAWRPPLVLERSPEKRLGGRDIPLGAEQEIDSLSLLVDRAIEVSPVALDLHVGFIDPPGSAGSACEAVPTLSICFQSRPLFGVRPYGRAGSGFDFDPLPGVVILKLLGAQISECRM